MSLMDKIFGGGSSATGTTVSPAGTQVSSSQATAPAPGPAPVAAPAQQTAATADDSKESSPLDIFSNLWKNPVDKDGRPIVHTDPLATPVFNLDPAKVQEQAKTLDFVKDVNPELLAKVVAGGEAAIPALMELLNSVQQTAFTAATLTTSRLVNDGISAHTAHLRQSLPTDFKRQQLAIIPPNEEHSEVLEHPAVKPLIAALRVQQFNKNPKANPADVARDVDNYIIGLAQAVGGKADASKTGEAATGNFNWNGWLDGAPMRDLT